VLSELLVAVEGLAILRLQRQLVVLFPAHGAED